MDNYFYYLDSDTLHIILSYLDYESIVNFIELYPYINIDYNTLMRYRKFHIYNDLNNESVYLGLLQFIELPEQMYYLPIGNKDEGNSIDKYLLRQHLIKIYAPLYISSLDDPEFFEEYVKLDTHKYYLSLKTWIYDIIILEAKNTLKYLYNIVSIKDEDSEFTEYVRDAYNHFHRIRNLNEINSYEDEDEEESNKTAKYYEESIAKSKYFKISDEFTQFVINLLKDHIDILLGIDDLHVLEIVTNNMNNPTEGEIKDIKNEVFPEDGVNKHNRDRVLFIFNKFKHLFTIEEVFNHYIGDNNDDDDY